MNVSSCNSVNSLIMYNMEIMIKISFAMTLMLTVIIDMIVSKCPYKYKKKCPSLSRPHQFQKRSFKKNQNLQDKTGCQKYKVSFTAVANGSKYFNIDIHKVQKSNLIKSQ